MHDSNKSKRKNKTDSNNFNQTFGERVLGPSRKRPGRARPASRSYLISRSPIPSVVPSHDLARVGITAQWLLLPMYCGPHPALPVIVRHCIPRALLCTPTLAHPRMHCVPDVWLPTHHGQHTASCRVNSGPSIWPGYSDDQATPHNARTARTEQSTQVYFPNQHNSVPSTLSSDQCANITTGEPYTSSIAWGQVSLLQLESRP